jgi:prepilin-type N-terminal cleavage/methylation domain-containing protein
MKKNKKTKTFVKKGFTLVELMVAMGIIGIMAAVVLVSLSGQRDKARATAALEVVRSVLPAAMDCNLRGVALYWNGVGSVICNGSSVTWPTLDTPSTQGWSMNSVYGPTNDMNNWYYYAYNSTTATYALCPVTYNGWRNWGGTNSVLPGSCVIRQ